uniref:Uncharacterized protein n=1 Tax=Chromera velia CCMP2878 TaxID=1169474 RepID=A0A0G4ICD6_9ALVE|eukprot:Cvel_13119.t1-p1 / transcript=Cvel_13119.t1 / gene=Cvel_13119 / organism=Chromera_velia_CCMP2878 / gene_product=Ankyrin-3, putative / transcript_product=Ankyrin-3, putative / location=Cvel_scaffold884:32585-34033(-) / protein_length=483 / sequence_SO=supercontig / SO=protein_coding / is_pseudo=false
MAETAVDPPLTTEAYLERLKAVHASIVADLDSRLRHQVELVDKTLRAKEAREGSAVAAANVSRVLPEDVSVLDVFAETGREFTRELSRKVRGQLGEVVSRHVKIDVGLLYELGIGEAIRSFRPVSSGTTQQALSDFISGASNGDDFRLFLKAGADVNGLVEGQTALIRSVCANHAEAFQMILEDGADLEARGGVVGGDESDVVPGDTALTAACRLRRWGMVHSLVAEGANADAVGGDGKKALKIACEAAERELDTSADPRYSTARLQYDPQNGDPVVRSTVNEVLKDLLTKTSDLPDLKIVRRDGVEGGSLIHFFAWHEFEELLLPSLSWNVEIDAVDRLGYTALMYAALRARTDYVKILVENGADVNKVNTYRDDTALVFAVAWRRFQLPHTKEESFVSSVRTVVDILLGRGANLNVRGHFGRTALHTAVVLNVIEDVRLLVEKGADLQVTDLAGQTPHELAVEYSRSPEMLALLVPPAAAE